MKNRKIRGFTALFLALILLALSLSACKSGDSNDNNNNTTAGGQNTNETFTEDGNPNAVPALPSMDFKGSDIKFLVRSSAAGDWENHEIYAEAQNAEPINDAVYLRNSALEERYKINIKAIPADDVTTSARNSILSGDMSYDAVATRLFDSLTIAADGTLLNLVNTEYLDLGGEWWDQRFVKEMTINNTLFYLTGDISTSAAEATWIMMFNKEIHQNLGMESLYDLVTTKKWTIDKFNQLIKDTHVDLNSNSKADKDDFFGMATHNFSITGFFTSTGLAIAEKDSSGVPVLTMNNPKTATIMEKTAALMKNNKDVYAVPVGQWADVQSVFENNRALFYGEVLQCVIRLRQMDTNFGILPYPMYDETQSEYNNYVAGEAAVYSIPYNHADPEKVSFVLEAICRESTTTLKPAFIETTLQGKQIRDNESLGMLEIILNSRKYDLGIIFDWGGLYSKYLEQTMAGRSNFVSMYESLEAKANTALEKFMELYE